MFWWWFVGICAKEPQDRLLCQHDGLCWLKRELAGRDISAVRVVAAQKIRQ